MTEASNDEEDEEDEEKETMNAAKATVLILSQCDQGSPADPTILLT